MQVKRHHVHQKLVNASKDAPRPFNLSLLNSSPWPLATSGQYSVIRRKRKMRLTGTEKECQSGGPPETYIFFSLAWVFFCFYLRRPS